MIEISNTAQWIKIIWDVCVSWGGRDGEKGSFKIHPEILILDLYWDPRICINKTSLLTLMYNLAEVPLFYSPF